MVYLNVVLTLKDAADIAFVRSTMTELGRLARTDAGCVRFEVYHSQSDPRVFFLNEQWKDAASLDAQRKSKPFVETYARSCRSWKRASLRPAGVHYIAACDGERSQPSGRLGRGRRLRGLA